MNPLPYKSVHTPGPHPHEISAMEFSAKHNLPPLGVLDEAQAGWAHGCRVEFCRKIKEFMAGKSIEEQQKIKDKLGRLLKEKRDADYWIEARGVWVSTFEKS